MILQVKDLSFRYDSSRRIFQNVNFELDKGEVLSILGTNGAGKSTLLNCLAGLFRPESSEILLGGRSMKTMSMADVAKIVGYVPQIHTPAYAYTVREFTVMGRTPYIGAFATPSKADYRIADEALERMNICCNPTNAFRTCGLRRANSLPAAPEKGAAFLRKIVVIGFICRNGKMPA